MPPEGVWVVLWFTYNTNGIRSPFVGANLCVRPLQIICGRLRPLLFLMRPTVAITYGRFASVWANT